MNEKDQKIEKINVHKEPLKQIDRDKGEGHTEKGARQVTQATGDPAKPPVTSSSQSKSGQGSAASNTSGSARAPDSGGKEKGA
jgi:hypothetical protein